jgi:hypothetical protein
VKVSQFRPMVVAFDFAQGLRLCGESFDKLRIKSGHRQNLHHDPLIFLCIGVEMRFEICSVIVYNDN